MFGKIAEKINPFYRDPKESARKMKSQLRIEIRRMDREMNSLTMEQKKVTKDIKAAASRGDVRSAQILARGVVRLRLAVARLAEAKANLIALSDQLTQAVAFSNVAGAVKLSADTMSTLNQMMKIPEAQKVAKDMAREMAKAGFIQESVGDALDISLGDESEIEEATDEAVNQVLMDVAGEAVAAMARAPSTKIAGRPEAIVAPEESKEIEADDDLMARVAGLRA
jgi:division protein CdvB (Snf7/Vps24/ESCRT-III family)